MDAEYLQMILKRKNQRKSSIWETENYTFVNKFHKDLIKLIFLLLLQNKQNLGGGAVNLGSSGGALNLGSSGGALNLGGSGGGFIQGGSASDGGLSLGSGSLGTASLGGSGLVSGGGLIGGGSGLSGGTVQLGGGSVSLGGGSSGLTTSYGPPSHSGHSGPYKRSDKTTNNKQKKE